MADDSRPHIAWARCLIQDSIIGAGATIGEGSQLMSCQVANGYDVRAQTSVKNEAFGERVVGDDEDDGEEWD
jgi:hypothetical protein